MMKSSKRLSQTWLIALLILLITPFEIARADRVKDLVSIAGVRDNQLLGYGLIVGLEGTGDKTGQVRFTEQSLRSMLTQYGVTIPEDVQIQPKNVAAVSVHATMPAFVKPGQKIDITVSSLGNASSLRGGTLLLTPLRGVDGNVYAVAQGEVIVSGIGAEGADGSSVAVNQTSVGRIANGANVEREVGSGFGNSDHITLNLHIPDFTTAKRVAEAINNTLGSQHANAVDAVSIVVQAPPTATQQVAFVSFLENIEVIPAENVAKIIVNSRTGTIVIGENVKVMPAAVAHGDLTVTINENVEVNQPNPLAGGTTAITPDSDVSVEEDTGALRTLNRSVTLREVVKTLNAVGATTSDLVAILEALKQVGALRAQLVII